jgi:hypothetical protein
MLDIWTSSAQPWVCFSQEIPKYPQSAIGTESPLENRAMPC